MPVAPRRGEETRPGKGTGRGRALGHDGTVDTNDLIHHQRSAHVAQLPSGARTFLSAGCSGRWYFDWIEQYYGPIPRHIGVEYYSSRPDDLPPNVTWVANTVGSMTDVADASVDLVYSGQNLEHLWLDDMHGFLCEASRVLRPGGTIAVDSPNRTQTSALNWTHPEHTVELTGSEAIAALELAGFSVTKHAGIWLTSDRSRVLRFECDDPADQIVRSVRAVDDPEHSFAWWIEGRKVRDAERHGLRRLLGEVFEVAWPERLERMHRGGVHVLGGSGELVNDVGAPAPVLFGPYAPLPRGEYAVRFTVRGVEPLVESPGEVDVVTDETVIARRPIPTLSPDQSIVLDLDFALAEPMNFGCQFRVLSNGSGRFRTVPSVELTDNSAVAAGPVYCRHRSFIDPEASGSP